MELYVLTENICQSEYTEPRYYCAAKNASTVVGVFSTRERAEAEKARLESLAAGDNLDQEYEETALSCEAGDLTEDVDDEDWDDDDENEEDEIPYYEIIPCTLDVVIK